MYRKQRKLTEKLLFEHYMISSLREDEIYSPFPFYIDQKAFEHMVQAAEVIDGLVNRLIDRLTEEKGTTPFDMGDFPLLDRVLELKAPRLPFFWARYDAFQRAEGGIFFSEFNYDKPCAQREILVSDLMRPYGNPNGSFAEKFVKGFEQCWKSSPMSKSGKKPTVAILVGYSRYEELHLAHLYMDLLEPLGYEFIIAGAHNFEVTGEKVIAFGKEIDIILRQFPTEYLHEVHDFEKILELFEEGKVQIVNDPRAIIGQVKSLFAYLWEMVEKEDSLLSEEEIKTIRETIPYTAVFQRDMAEKLLQSKDRWVIKAAYGRYSQEVYIGSMMNDEEWLEIIQYVLESEALHIIQQFCPIKRERVIRLSEGYFREVEAFGNFGIYLTNGEFTGVCARWSRDYLTCDDTVWITSVGVREKGLRVKAYDGEDRKAIWNAVNDTMAFDWRYTGGYTNCYESFTLDSLLLDKRSFLEIKQATERTVEIIKKTAGLVRQKPEMLCLVLGISESLSRLIAADITSSLCFVGRMDWVLDTTGRLRLLEFNSETPGGIIEAAVMNGMIAEKLGDRALENPNDKLGECIRESFLSIVQQYQGLKEIKNIGIISSTFYEDWYNTTTIYEYLKELPYSFTLGEISGIEVKDGQLYLYRQPLDAIYRHYPLDWLDSDPYYSGVIEALKDKTLSLNPPSTLISQSKAFFALIWELYDHGFYSEAEMKSIESYIPKTALSPDKLGLEDFCVKPLFGREGEGIRFSLDGNLELDREQEYIFQERVDILGIELDIYSTVDCRRDIVYPVIGAFVTGDSFAGLFTRAGGKVTDKWVVFMPAFVEK